MADGDRGGLDCRELHERKDPRVADHRGQLAAEDREVGDGTGEQRLQRVSLALARDGIGDEAGGGAHREEADGKDGEALVAAHGLEPEEDPDQDRQHQRAIREAPLRLAAAGNDLPDLLPRDRAYVLDHGAASGSCEQGEKRGFQRTCALVDLFDVGAGRDEQSHQRRHRRGRRQFDVQLTVVRLERRDLRKRAERVQGGTESAALDGDGARGSVPQVVGWTFGDQPTVPDHADAVTHALGFVEIVRGDEHGHALSPSEIEQVGAEPGCRDGVEACGGLVEEDHGWTMEERASRARASASFPCSRCRRARRGVPRDRSVRAVR